MYNTYMYICAYILACIPLLPSDIVTVILGAHLLAKDMGPST